MSGNANSGRKRKSLNRTQAQRILTLKLPKAIEVIGDTMEGLILDRLRYEAAISIKDSVLGKPKQSTELDLKDKERIGVGFLVELTALIAASRRDSSQGYMLEEGNNAVQRLTEAEGLRQREDEEGSPG